MYLVDARGARLCEGLHRGLRAPVLGLDEEGGDEEPGAVEAVRAVHRDHVQGVLLHVPLALEHERVHLRCSDTHISEHAQIWDYIP